MINESALHPTLPQTPDAMTTLAGYLDMLLFKGGSLVMMQQCDGVCGMYAGQTGSGQSELHYLGNIDDPIAGGILRGTATGRNRLDISGTFYHFIRSYAHFEDRSAVVFYPL